jgi:membrane fusion protein, multidrug efflux system
LFRRHFFLVSALGLLAVMVVLGVARRAFGTNAQPGAGGAGGGPPAAAGKSGGARGPGGPGGGALVTPAVVRPHVFTEAVDVLGVARGRQSVTITSSTTELVTKVRFRDGQQVTKGAVLVDLQAGEEEADIITARAAATQADRQYRRWKVLADKGIAAPAALDQYRSAAEQARANLQAALSRRGDRVIRAPFSGVVGLSTVTPGTLINPGATIATLDDVSVIRVDFDVPDRYLSLLRPGAPIAARPDALPGQTFPGRIATLDSRVDERTRTIRARAEFANPGGLLKPGMMIRVGIQQGQRQSLAVPEAAVQYVGDSANVFIIQRQNGRATAEQRPVTLGASDNGLVEIRDGVRPGEQVVADGVSRLQPGQPLRLPGARTAGVGGPAR